MRFVGYRADFIAIWNLRTAILLVSVLLSGCATPVSGGQEEFSRAVAAYDAGDHATSFRIWNELASKGDVAAARNAAKLLRQGKGVEKDLERAFTLFKYAADIGLVTAMADVGDMYLAGEGVKKDARSAAAWYEKASQAGLSLAHWKLAELFENGNGVEKNRTRSIELMKLAAQKGFQPAQMKLASMGISYSAIASSTSTPTPDSQTNGISDGSVCLSLGFKPNTIEMSNCRLRVMEMRQQEATRNAQIAEQERRQSLEKLKLGLCLMNGTCGPTRRPPSRSDDDDPRTYHMTLPNGNHVNCVVAGPSINCR